MGWVAASLLAAILALPHPATAAAAAVGKYKTLRSRGGTAGQMGRQKTRVVLTPTKNRPSKRASRASRARRQVTRSRWSDSIPERDYSADREGRLAVFGRADSLG